MQILNYEEQPYNTSIIGVFSVYFPETHMILHKLKVMKTTQGHLRVLFPCYSVTTDGVKKWDPYYDFSKERKNEFMKQILEALKPFLT